MELSSHCLSPPLKPMFISKIFLNPPKGVPRLLKRFTTKVVHFFPILFLLSLFFATADVVPPVFLSCPSDIRANLGISSSVLVNWTIPVALDNSNMAPQISVSPPGVTPPYTFYNNTNIVYTAKDPSGLERKCSFRVLLEGA